MFALIDCCNSYASSERISVKITGRTYPKRWQCNCCQKSKIYAHLHNARNGFFHLGRSHVFDSQAL